jgi:CheY-like chemotaxis protein
MLPKKNSKLILLVQSSPDEVLFFDNAFKAWGIENPWHVAASGTDALDYCSGKGFCADRKHYPLPTLVVVNPKLSDMAGHQLIQRIRKCPGLGRLPIVLLVDKYDAADARAAYKLGATCSLFKTTSLPDLRYSFEHLNDNLRLWQFPDALIQFPSHEPRDATCSAQAARFEAANLQFLESCK